MLCSMFEGIDGLLLLSADLSLCYGGWALSVQFIPFEVKIMLFVFFIMFYEFWDAFSIFWLLILMLKSSKFFNCLPAFLIVWLFFRLLSAGFFAGRTSSILDV